MLRFIDLTGQIYLDDEEKSFAFFDTVRDKFCEFSGCQQWDSIEEFKNDYTGDEINRYLSLIPQKFYTYTWKDVSVRLLGEEIVVQPIQYADINTNKKHSK